MKNKCIFFYLPIDFHIFLLERRCSSPHKLFSALYHIASYDILYTIYRGFFRDEIQSAINPTLSYGNCADGSRLRG